MYDGRHEAIVDEALWHRVNPSQATKERRAGGRPLTAAHLLTRGQLRCGLCGSAIIPYALTGRADTYRCSGRHQHGPDFCAQGHVLREQVDDALLSELTSRYSDLDGTRDRMRERQASELPTAQAAVVEAEGEVAAAQARIAKIVRSWQDEVISDDEYQRQRAALDEAQGADQAVAQAKTRPGLSWSGPQAPPQTQRKRSLPISRISGG